MTRVAAGCPWQARPQANLRVIGILGLRCKLTSYSPVTSGGFPNLAGWKAAIYNNLAPLPFQLSLPDLLCS
jgi:hypothetical protein